MTLGSGRGAILALGLAVAVCGAALPAAAQDTSSDDAPERRTRVGLGAQLVNTYPGADTFAVRPMFEFSRATGDDVFDFEAQDEGIGFPIFTRDGFAAGSALGFQGSRTGDDVGVPLAKVKATFELGGFVQYNIAPPLRLRLEVRRGLGGHDGWIGVVSADYVARDGDAWLFAIGPRLTLADNRYNRAYFSVSPADAVRSGLPGFRADGGVQAVGAGATFLRQLTPRLGVFSYAKYDRLVDDAGRSPIVRRFGSRDQPSGGVGVTYTFGVRSD